MQQPSDSRRQIPLFDSLTTPARDEEGHGIALGDFAVNIRNVPDRTRLHRHNYPELFYFHEGEGSHRNDFCDYGVEAPCLVFVDAGHVHAWPEALKLKGDMLSFDAGFILRGCTASQPVALFLPPAPVILPLGKAEDATVTQLFGRVRTEWRERQEGWVAVLRSCLSLLHVEALRIHRRLHEEAGRPETSAARLCREFLLLLEKNVHAATAPRKLAAVLGVSADHLSATLRATTGRTAQQHIQDRLLLEARRLLAHSHLDAAEIAWHLGYRDVSYFGRVFRRREGISPGQFRKRFQPKTDFLSSGEP